MLCSIVISIFIGTVLSECPFGYFKLRFMKHCFPWLNCDDISRIQVHSLIGYGSTKSVCRALWMNHNVTYISLRNKMYRYDYYAGLHNMKMLSSSSHVVQLLGFCEAMDVIISEYHEYNNALHIDEFRERLSLKESFKFCYSYAIIIDFLHNSPIGILVNCDSNDLPKLLSQLLITTEFNLILGDLDALPEVGVNKSIICGPREIKSSFAAPEQLWNKPGPFDTRLMKGYTEKSDIWKVPDVCHFFLKNSYEFLQYRLFEIHSQCKSLNPFMRPTATTLMRVYYKILISL